MTLNTESDVDLEEVPVRNFTDQNQYIDENDDNNIYRRQDSATMNFDINTIKSPIDAY